MVTLKRNGIPGYALIIMLTVLIAPLIVLAGPAGGQMEGRASTDELLHNLTHKDAKDQRRGRLGFGKKR